VRTAPSPPFGRPPDQEDDNGLTTRPMKRIVPVFVSRRRYMNGWSAWKAMGVPEGQLSEIDPIATAVTALVQLVEETPERHRKLPLAVRVEMKGSGHLLPRPTSRTLHRHRERDRRADGRTDQVSLAGIDLRVEVEPELVTRHRRGGRRRSLRRRPVPQRQRGAKKDQHPTCAGDPMPLPGHECNATAIQRSASCAAGGPIRRPREIARGLASCRHHVAS
jgi:hypothetical protein